MENQTYKNTSFSSIIKLIMDGNLCKKMHRFEKKANPEKN